jgi:ADP-ribose pyrophosphatase
MEFTERLTKKHRVYSGKAISLRADEIVLPDGNRATREYMEHPGAVAVIPFIDEENIVLVKQYRFPVKVLTYELPAGKLDKGEKPDVCVRRELQEETGYRAKKIQRLLSYWPTPAFSTEVIHIYSANGLTASTKSPDEDEFIDHKILPFAKALEWVKNGKIMDSKTIIGLLYWANRKEKRLQRNDTNE